jgi:hypothetical protein
MNSLARTSSCFARLLFALGLAMLVSGLNAQQDIQPHQRIALPQDWTHAHVLFSANALVTNPALAEAEPRAVHQWLRQNMARFPNFGAHREHEFRFRHQSPLHRDWSVTLGGGRLAPAMSPAKFSFDTTAAPDCANDYVAFGLNTPGSNTQANLVAFNNLYSGPGGQCGTGDPLFLFSYNVSTAGGAIATSPVLSLDGKKIAFVESAGGSSIFHVLTWATGTGNGTSATAPAVPGVGNTASMTSLTYAAATNTRSSPWIDYTNDTAYVGANNGNVYKITGVFHGTPALAGAPWPVSVSAGNTITSPVLDNVTSRLFVGDAAGRLCSVNYVTPGAVATLPVGSTLASATNRAVLDAPIVDQSNGVVYAISSNDGMSAVLVQASTSTLVEMTRARIGLGSTTGTTVNLYDGTPDDSYFNSPATGSFLVCGTGAADTTPTLYSFGFVGTTLNITPTSTAQIVNDTGARCSPITEFFNPNVGAGGTDFFFFGLTSSCPKINSGCVMSRTVGGILTQGPEEPGGTSGIVMDNQSLLGQASSIYFTPLNPPNRATKVTQNGLL